MAEVVSVASKWLGRELRLSESRAVVPNILARSKVFSSQPNHVARTVFTTDTVLAAWGADRIYQVGGAQLTQAEESIWLVLVRLALALSITIDLKKQNKVLVEFKEADMLRALDMPVTSQYRTALRTAMSYLGRARYKIELGSDDNMYEGNLLDLERRTRVGETGYRVWLDMKLSSVFMAGWSFLNFDHRMALRQNPLAQWLLTHYTTHKTPVPVHHALLQELADRSSMRADKWLQALRTALIALNKTTSWTCKLDHKGMVSVSRKEPAIEPVVLNPDSADGRLINAWLAALSREKLAAQIERIGFKLYRYNIAHIQELRILLRGLLEANPAILEKRLKVLRDAKEDNKPSAKCS